MSVRHNGVVYGRATVGNGKRVHFVAESWLAQSRHLVVTTACGRKGMVASLHPEGEPCRDCSYISA